MDGQTCGRSSPAPLEHNLMKLSSPMRFCGCNTVSSTVKTTTVVEAETCNDSAGCHRDFATAAMASPNWMDSIAPSVGSRNHTKFGVYNEWWRQRALQVSVSSCIVCLFLLLLLAPFSAVCRICTRVQPGTVASQRCMK